MIKFYLQESFMLNCNKLVRVYKDKDDRELYVIFGDTLIQYLLELRYKEGVFHTNYRKTIKCWPIVSFYKHIKRKKDYFPSVIDEAICFGTYFETLMIGSYEEVFQYTVERLYEHNKKTIRS